MSQLVGLRATRAYIDLDAIGGNVQAVRRHVPESTQIMAIVKADAYGHGAPWVARAALDAGATRLGVATVGEGEELRNDGVTCPILVLGPIDLGEALRACRLGLEMAIGGIELLDAVQRAARSPDLRSPVAVHLKIDTGM